LELLPNADANIQELTQLNRALEERFKLLKDEWAKVESNLQNQLDNLMKANNTRKVQIFSLKLLFSKFF
jgi:hypothetical protein